MTELIGTPGHQPQLARYNTKLVVAVVLGAVAVLCLLFAGLLSLLLGVTAAILGHLGLREIKATGERSHGLGVAGLVLGYLAAGVVLLALVAGIAVVGGAASTYGPGASNPDACTWPTNPTPQQEQKCFDSGSR